MSICTKFGVFAIAVAGLVLPGITAAAVCSPSEPANFTTTSLSDVQIEGVSAGSCSFYAGNNDNGYSPGAGWTNLGKSDAENPILGSVNLLPGGVINLSLAVNNPTTGDLLLSWTGGPALMDFAFSLKGGSVGYIVYFFEDYLLTPANSSDTGEYTMSIRNNGGQIAGLSHLTFFAKGDQVPTEVPEPMSLALLGLGLIGLGATRRFAKRS